MPENYSNAQHMGTDFVENREKNLSLHIETDRCGQGLINMCIIHSFMRVRLRKMGPQAGRSTSDLLY